MIASIRRIRRIPGARARAEQAGLVLSRAFCVLAGAFLFADSVAALVFTEFDLSTGDDLPRDEWNFIFAFNTWHHFLHMVTASVLLVAALRREWAPVGALVFGAVYVVLAPVGWIDGDDAFDLFYNAAHENVVHTSLAALGVGLGALGLLALRRG